MPGQTPYKSFSYPLPGEVIGDAILGTLAGQINTAGVAVNTTLLPNATARPAALINLTSPQSLPKTVETAIVFAAPAFDTSGGVYWVAGTPTRVIAPATGLYSVTCQVQVNTSAGATQKIQAKICKNGSTAAPNYTASSMSYSGIASPGNWQIMAHGLVSLLVTEYVTVSVFWLGAAAGPYSITFAQLSIQLLAIP